MRRAMCGAESRLAAPPTHRHGGQPAGDAVERQQALHCRNGDEVEQAERDKGGPHAQAAQAALPQAPPAHKRGAGRGNSSQPSAEQPKVIPSNNCRLRGSVGRHARHHTARAHPTFCHTTSPGPGAGWQRQADCSWWMRERAATTALSRVLKVTNAEGVTRCSAAARSSPISRHSSARRSLQDRRGGMRAAWGELAGVRFKHRQPAENLAATSQLTASSSDTPHL